MPVQFAGQSVTSTTFADEEAGENDPLVDRSNTMQKRSASHAVDVQDDEPFNPFQASAELKRMSTDAQGAQQTSRKKRVRWWSVDQLKRRLKRNMCTVVFAGGIIALGIIGLGIYLADLSAPKACAPVSNAGSFCGGVSSSCHGEDLSDYTAALYATAGTNYLSNNKCPDYQASGNSTKLSLCPAGVDKFDEVSCWIAAPQAKFSPTKDEFCGSCTDDASCAPKRLCYSYCTYCFSAAECNAMVQRNEKYFEFYVAPSGFPDCFNPRPDKISAASALIPHMLAMAMLSLSVALLMA
eukprot:GFYU01011454.1.p1 GENE.GFYU01011454.1~~GFYU01011454.1.p1  ORF type:complete len:296 (+),score=28.89 GFYU01011454.1:110-997(+)